MVIRVSDLLNRPFRLCGLQFFNSFYHLQPHRLAIQIPLGKHFIRLHGGLNRCLVAMLLNKKVGGAVNIDFSSHLPCLHSHGSP